MNTPIVQYTYEHCLGLPITWKSNMWMIGSIAYWLVTGRYPFESYITPQNHCIDSS